MNLRIGFRLAKDAIQIHVTTWIIQIWQVITHRISGKCSLALLTIGVLYACSNQHIHHIDILTLEKPLHKDSVVSFSFFIEDTTKIYSIKSLLFYSGDYPYSNLYLRREINYESNAEYTDTANYILFDSYGKMTGKGFTNVKKLENSVGRGPLRFRNVGYYTVEFNHLMRIDSLPGISKIGILITELTQ